MINRIFPQGLARVFRGRRDSRDLVAEMRHKIEEVERRALEREIKKTLEGRELIKAAKAAQKTVEAARLSVNEGIFQSASSALQQLTSQLLELETDIIYRKLVPLETDESRVKKELKQSQPLKSRVLG